MSGGTAWPGLNTKAWLRLPCCNEEHPTRIEDFAGTDDCVVAEPLAPHTSKIRTDDLGKGFFLGWTNGRSALEAPVELVAESSEPIPTWRLRSVGEVNETQRRRFVRVSVEVPVKLHLIERSMPFATNTTTLSEGGQSCVVDRWAPDPRTRIFESELEIDGSTHLLKTQVAWWGSLDADDNRAVGMQFVNSTPQTCDTIRSFVFSTQLLQRRAAAQ